jgi:hypothetical protein
MNAPPLPEENPSPRGMLARVLKIILGVVFLAFGVLGALPILQDREILRAITDPGSYEMTFFAGGTPVTMPHAAVVAILLGFPALFLIAGALLLLSAINAKPTKRHSPPENTPAE